MAVGQTIPTTPRYAATILTSDPTSGTIQANIKGDSRSIIVINTPIAFRWPIDGETWVVRQENGTWYLDSPIPDPNASTSFKSINPGDAIINSPTGVVHVIGGEDGTDFSFNNTSFTTGDLISSASATRAGCLPCNGTAVSRSTYSRLFAVIGPTFRSGDGFSTFNVPTISPLISGINWFIVC